VSDLRRIVFDDHVGDLLASTPDPRKRGPLIGWTSQSERETAVRRASARLADKAEPRETPVVGFGTVST
jgi:hypothetical protein